jgi:two-component system response regulator AtoC
MAFEKLLVVDDELMIRKSLEAQLRKKRYVVASAATLEDARSYLKKDHFDLIFLDMRLPDGEGTALLTELHQLPNPPMVVMVTGYGSIESAVECIKNGAFDYIVKPCSLEQIDVVLKKAENYSQLVKVNRYFNEQLIQDTDLLGLSQSMEHLRQMIHKVAASEATVLVTGENGTGKELVAREIYRLSPLKSKPYVRVNCAAIPENLIESEFFGHEKGAFTGASERREGRFELANGGTILLDEIGEVSLSLQVKLLRVLQEQEFERVGGTKTIKVNVRVIATTNRDLLKAVQAGTFREDLYYRLNVFPIVVPSLRDRKEDIPLLAQTFLDQLARKKGIALTGFTEEALHALNQHNWPGNVRELHNVIERAVILSETGPLVSVDAFALPAAMQMAPLTPQQP